MRATLIKSAIYIQIFARIGSADAKLIEIDLPTLHLFSRPNEQHFSWNLFR